jgi:hypothetical protein
MDGKPVAILERLLKQEPGPRNAHYLKASRDFFDCNWTYEEVQAIEDEFARDFRTVAAQVEAAWGPPDFIGYRTESEFPEFCTAEEFCYWRKGKRLAMIWWEHQDKEVPVLLTLAVLTPEDLRGRAEH